MDLHLRNKIVFIAGSSNGLGLAIAEQLLQEDAVVIINGRNSQRLKMAKEILHAKYGENVQSLLGDVTDQNFATRLNKFISDKFGKLDILITNSGGPGKAKFESISDDEWQNAYELTFLSHVRLIRTLLPLLRKSPTANVLTITSVSVKQPIQDLILSNSLRAATVGLTKTLALELADEGIRFNSILPGWTKTDRVNSLMKSSADQNNTTIEQEMKKQSGEIALGRMAEPEEFANVATFLVSPRASYLTGTMLSVDGGSVKGIF